MTPYLKIDHVDKSFNRGSRETEVLKDITLGVEKGEYVSIIGHSGCGKSTLLNIVAGLTPVTQRRACCWRTRRSTSRARTAPWCSRTTRCCRGSRSTTTCGSRSTRCSAGQELARRAPRLDDAQSRAGADGARQGQAAGGNLRRHEAARRHCPRAGDGAEGAAARRAVRRARRADPRASAGLGDGDPPEARQHRA